MGTMRADDPEATSRPPQGSADATRASTGYSWHDTAAGVTNPDDATPAGGAAPVDEWLAVLGHDREATSRLSRQLVAAAQEHDLLDVAYRVVDSPIGDLLLAATPRGLVRVAFSVEDLDQVLLQLAQRISPRILRAPRRLDAPARELEEYFAGRRREFEVPLDLRLTTDFRRRVIGHLVDIAYGRTESYAQVAAATGNPRAVRAVGTACATNPLPVVVPCHRVVRSDGSVGGYLGGPQAKRMLLQLEAA